MISRVVILLGVLDYLEVRVIENSTTLCFGHYCGSNEPTKRRERRCDAEPLLVNSCGYHQLKGVSEPETHARESLRRIIDLYEAWHAAEPDEGYDAKAAEWRFRLDDADVNVQNEFRGG